MTRLLTCLLIIMATFLPLHAANKRVALVIGNAAYTHAARLNNPIKDSKDVAAALRRLDFEVAIYQNVNFFEMRKAIANFGKEARTADMAVFYYAGHGMEMRGENWLIPVDAVLSSDYDTEDEAIDLNYVLGKLRGTENLGLVILDACRNNPFTSNMSRSEGINRSVNRGFARVEPENNVLVAYAAREGTLAQDGKIGENSPYATALLKHIETPNLDVRFIFGRVRDSVVSMSQGDQIPHIYGSLPGRSIVLKSKKANSDKAEEIAFWNSVRNSPEKSRLQSYLDIYNEGSFSGLARAKIELIDRRRELDNQKIEFSQKKTELEKMQQEVLRLQAEQHKIASLSTSNNSNNITKDLSPTENLKLGLQLFERKSFSRAAYHIRLSAEGGDIDGMVKYASLLETGNGIPKNTKQSHNWFIKAAKHNSPTAIFRVGRNFERGSAGLKKNPAQAMIHYIRAADLGNGDAMNNIGVLYLLGEGIDKNTKLAVHWFQKGVTTGNANAMFNLSALLDGGQGIPRNPSASAKSVYKAIAAGNEHARLEMKNNANAWSLQFRKELQILLKKEKYYIGKIDGKFGAGTFRAIEQIN